MKRKLTLSIALVLSMTIVSLISSDSTTQAQNQSRVVADSGVVTLGQNQALRLTVSAGSGNDALTVRFRQLEYMQTACNGGVCKHAVSSQTTSNPITLAPGEAASSQITGKWYEVDLTSIRAMVLSNSRDVIVNAQIVNTSTGEVTSQIVFDTSTQR